MIYINPFRKKSACQRWLFTVAAALALLGSAFSSLQAQTMTVSVADYGAQGDAVQFWVGTTSGSPVITTTNQLSSADIGKAIEVFAAGPATGPVNNQDLIATITQVINGTNVTISLPAGASLTSAYATYGHNNQPYFQAAVAACGSATNAIVNIPAGNYLILSASHPGSYGNCGILLTSGGIHLVGAGSSNTVLLSQGAWTLQGGNAWRGILIEVARPVVNDYPVSLENLTLDGGVQQGNSSNHNFPASVVDGTGWDETHDAIILAGNSGNEFTSWTWTNLVFQHWRGEIVKSIDQSTNGNLGIFNCTFTDGNASAINIYPSLNVSNCVFNNLFQVAEYYQAYYTNTGYFQNNLVTNITGNGFALNGAKGNNPPFFIQGNTFYLQGGNGIETTPGDNISIISNQFICQNDNGDVIVLGAAGYQGSYCNSNILIAYNNFVAADNLIEIAGGVSATDPSRVQNVEVYSNTLTGVASSGWAHALTTYNWASHIHFFGNDFSTRSTANVAFSSGAMGGQIAAVETNNLYSYRAYGFNSTNYIDYVNGSKFVAQSPAPNMVYVLQDYDASQIPAGAQLVVSNSTAYSYPFPLYLNSAMTAGPLVMTNGASFAFQWLNGAWQTVSSPTPPTNLHIVSQ
jgi:hypothetical protein